ncbi:MAG TPA: penicillin-binding protein [Vicinamibacterales bacterium]|jgi:cell division protein FtsI (penicillin-binding protein 3)
MSAFGRNRPVEMVAGEHGRRRAASAWIARLRAALPARRGVSPRPDDWRSTLHARIVVCAVLFACWTAAIEARLIFLQLIDHADLMARADRQQLRTLNPPAKRGEIVDRGGRVLAYSVDADTIAADPSEIDDPDSVARQVCAALEGCTSERRADMAKKLRRKGAFVYLGRQMSPEEARPVRDLQLPGIIFLKENRRYYPKRELGAHVLGYVGLDNVGLGGIESAYDTEIRGHDGKVLIQTDARRHALSSRVERPATAGASIELTIDQYLQYIAERELRVGVEENHAAGGSAIIMNPYTGEILALANWPTFNPNAFSRSDDDARRNRAIQTLYEPGSTFKIVTASAALEQHAVTPDTPVETSPGYISFGSRVIHDTHMYGLIPFTDVIVKSSNVGAIKVGMKVGAQALGEYIGRFGFGQTLGPDFRGETAGIVWDTDRLDASALASVSMGYQIGVTPLQMVTAASSIANGGHLLEPRVVRAFIKDGHRTEVPHKVLRQTVNAETAATLTTIMEQVVERGTARAAQIPGFTIAGKTGTAAKLINGHYQKSDYNASFVGFIPSRKPVVTILVVIDSPHGAGYTGGAVSAPVFKRIAEATLRYLGVGPTLNAPPPVLVARHDPDATTEVKPAKAEPEEEARTAIELARSGLMPDLRGLSAREAVRTLSQIGMTARMSGDGLVVTQSPEPGDALVPGGVCSLKLNRRQPTAPLTGGAPQ